MNEIRPATGPDSPNVEVAPAQPEPAELSPSVDSPADGLDENGAWPPHEHRFTERRVAHRYRSKEGRCWIGWNDAGVFRQSAAWIIDISVSGSLVATDVSPPTDRSVWIRLDAAAAPEWAEARVVDFRKGNAGIHATRLVFRGMCPYSLIKATAFSAGPDPARPTPSASSWKLNSW